MKCDSCAMVSINGIACHEYGCSNIGKRYESAGDYWITQRACRECGYTVDHDDPCCCHYDDDGEDC